MRSSRRAHIARARLSGTPLLATIVLVAALLPAIHHGAPAAALDPESRALRLAAATDQPVVIDADTTQTSITQAMPDGSLQATFNAVPVRVQQHGAWVPVDASLLQNVDGSYSPAAATNPLAISAGGSTTLATLHNDNDTLTLTWPTTLPTPAVAGSTATYADVLPDVDLEVTATTVGGISEVLVVKNAQAAANPALHSLRIGTHVTAGSLSESSDNVSATGGDGNTAFHAAAPVMWDSSPANASSSTATAPRAIAGMHLAGAQPDADGSSTPSSSSTVAPVAVDVSATAVTLTPDQQMLSSPDTVYPVYIDPTWVPTKKDPSGWTWAQQAFPNTSHWEDVSEGSPAVGYQGWEAGSMGKNRSFWQFNIGSLGTGNYLIHSASFQTKETDTGLFACNVWKYIDVSGTTHISSATTWNNQPGPGHYLDHQPVYGASQENGCSHPTNNFDVTYAVAHDTDGIVTFRVYAEDETDKDYYRRFGGTWSSLTIEYDRPPNAPTSPKISPAPLHGSSDCTDYGDVGWVGAAPTNITFSAHVSDPDAGTSPGVRAEFDIWDKGGDGTATSPNVISPSDSAGWTGYEPTTTGGTASKAVPVSYFKNGHMYGLDAWGYDGNMMSASSSDHCYFWYDNTKPSISSLTSADFTMTGATMVGQSGTIHVTAADVVPSGANYSGIDHFAYATSSAAALAGDGGAHITATRSGPTGSATITLTPTTWGVNYLYVAAVDRAGNQSATATFEYYVRDNPAATVHPGDVDGDGRPDLLAATSGGNLLLYPTIPDTPLSSTDDVVSTGDQSPDHTSWANTLIAHRSSTDQSPTGARVDDLYAYKNGVLELYPNNINHGGIGTAGDGGNLGLYYTANNAITVNRPACTYDTTACASYTGDWGAVTQLLAPGDLDGDGIPDLLTVENGRLWLFRGTTQSGRLTNPQLMPSAGWNNVRIMAPGDNTGDGIPDIWSTDARFHSDGGDGMFRLYPVTRDCSGGPPCTVGIGTVATSTGDWGPDAFKLVTSPGDADGNPVDGTPGDPGAPDLYAIYNTGSHGQLFTYIGTNPTGLGLSTHRVVDDGTNHNWYNITNLA